MKSRFNQRKRNRIKSKELLSKLSGIFRVSVFSVIIFVTTFLLVSIIRFFNKYSFEKTVNSVVVYKDGLTIIRFDPFYNELLTLNVYENISVESAGGFGNYPLKNIYALSENEKKGDEMFRKTIMRNFHIPIYGTVDCRNQMYEKRSLLNLVLSCSKTKDFDDMLYLIYTKWKTGSNKIEKNIEDYRGVFAKEEESDEDFHLNENVFEKLELDFSQSVDIDDVVNISIKTIGEARVPDYFSDVIRAMGGRVVETDSGSDFDVDFKTCKISGSNKVFIKNIGKVFGCEVVYLKDNADSELYFSPEYLNTF